MSSHCAQERNQVIDLSSTVDAPDDVRADSSDNHRSLFSGVKLKDLRVGDRLGARRDGGEGFQVRWVGLSNAAALALMSGQAVLPTVLAHQCVENIESQNRFVQHAETLL